MPVDYSRAGTNRDKPRYLPANDDRVLRQAIEKLGVVAGLSTAEVQALIDASVAAFASAGAFDTAAPTSAVAAVAEDELVRQGEFDTIVTEVYATIATNPIDPSVFTGSLAGSGITTTQGLAEWVDANVVVMP